MPLFGIHYMFMLFFHEMTLPHTPSEYIWLYSDLSFTTLQGCLVSILYCFWCADVRYEVRKFISKFSMSQLMFWSTSASMSENSSSARVNVHLQVLDNNKNNANTNFALHNRRQQLIVDRNGNNKLNNNPNNQMIDGHFNSNTTSITAAPPVNQLSFGGGGNGGNGAGDGGGGCASNNTTTTTITSGTMPAYGTIIPDSNQHSAGTPSKRENCNNDYNNLYNSSPHNSLRSKNSYLINPANQNTIRDASNKRQNQQFFHNSKIVQQQQQQQLHNHNILVQIQPDLKSHHSKP